MAYGLSDQELLATAQRVNEQSSEPEGEYDMGRRHEYEIAALETQKASEREQLLQQQGVLGGQVSRWQAQGVDPASMQRAKSQLSRYFGVPGTRPTPPPQGVLIEGGVSSPTQGDLVNPAVSSIKSV
jgi:hypothetical protein